eukprot:6463292-Amphidinium_carterae.1
MMRLSAEEVYKKFDKEVCLGCVPFAFLSMSLGRTDSQAVSHIARATERILANTGLEPQGGGFGRLTVDVFCPVFAASRDISLGPLRSHKCIPLLLQPEKSQ